MKLTDHCRTLVLVFTLLITSLAASDEDRDGGKESFKPLFNGRDLTGWVRVNTAPSTWTVRDGMVICSGKPIGELRTERMYQNFILELEWRHMRPKGNAGIFVWADDITARGVPFHRSIEVQVLENAYGNNRSHTTHGDIFPIHGAKMNPINGRGGSRAFPTEFRSRPSPEWNHYRIECRDGNIALAVNGKVVTRGKDCVPRKGYICLESEGGIVHYRNLRIRELSDTPIDPKHVATADRGYRCLYSGLDLGGWKTRSPDSWQPHDWVLKYTGDNAKSAGADPSIATTEEFGDFGFVVDVRLPRKFKSLQIRLRDSERLTIDVDRKNPQLAAHLKGRWTRFEGAVRGRRMSLTVNGNAVKEEVLIEGDVPARGPLRLVPSGPVDVANIYVRELEE